MAAPAVFGTVGLAVDYVTLASYRSTLQEIADSAALASTKEMMVTGTTDTQIKAVVNNFVVSGLPDMAADGGLSANVKIDRKVNEVHVKLSYVWKPSLPISSMCRQLR